MNHLKILCIGIFSLLSGIMAFAESNYDISEFYSVIKPAAGTKAIGKFSTTIEAEYILSPTRVETGKFV